MLFLLHDTLVDVAVPAFHLERRWPRLGCGAPHAMTALDVIEFVQKRLNDMRAAGISTDELTARDLASLVVARTGANSLVLRRTADGATEPVLKIIPQYVMEAYASGAANDEGAAPLNRAAPRMALN